jgi:hypothetical protein
MHIEPKRAVGALYKCERAYLRITNRAQPKLTLRATTQRALQRLGERAENIGTESSVIAQGAAKSPRERADPLTDRDLGKHGIDQVRGDVRHTTTQTGRAETPTHAGETHHHLMTASAARELDEAVVQNPAAEIRVELLLHELRQAASGFGALGEQYGEGHKQVQRKSAGNMANSMGEATCGRPMAIRERTTPLLAGLGAQRAARYVPSAVLPVGTPRARC